MTIFLACCRTTLRFLVWPFLGTLVGCALALLAVSFDPDLDRESSGYWLHLPGLLLTATGLAAALEAWPLLSRERPGFEWLHRLENRPLHGSLVASLGALTALGLALLATGALFPTLQSLTGSNPGPVRARVAFTADTDRPNLGQKQRRLVYATAEPTPIDRLVIRPIGVVGPGHDGLVSLRVTADGQPLHAGELLNLGDVIQLPIIPTRDVTTLEITRVGDDGVLLLIPGTAVAGFTSTSIPSAWNGSLAGLSYLLPALLAFGVMILGHRRLSLPANFTAGLGIFLLLCLTEATPHGQAIAAFARGRYLAEEELLAPTVQTVGVFAGLVLVAFGLGTRRIRR